MLATKRPDHSRFANTSRSGSQSASPILPARARARARQALRLALVAELGGGEREHLSVQHDQAVETHVLAVEGVAAGYQDRFVVHGRVVHARFVPGRERGAAIQAVTDRRSAVLEQAVGVAVTLAPPPLMIGEQGLPGVLEQAPHPPAPVEKPQHEGADGRLRTIDPGIAAGQQAGKIARLGASCEHRAQVLLRELQVEHSCKAGVIQDIVEPHPEPAELGAGPVAAERGVGPPVHGVEDGVPADDVPDGIERTVVPACVQTRTSSGRRHRWREDGGAPRVWPRRVRRRRRPVGILGRRAHHPA